MTARIIEGKLVLSICEMLESLTPEEKRHIAEALACENDIITDVAAQLMDGWTEAGSHGAKGTVCAEPITPLDKARRQLAMRAGDAAKRELLALEEALDRAETDLDKYREWGWRLYNKMQNAEMNPERWPT